MVSKGPAGPRKWCEPASAFGKPNAEVRVWQPPDGSDKVEVAQFRAAVMQNVICIFVREHKEASKTPQRELASRDGRYTALDMWNARLNGRENLTISDIATLIAVLPGAMPHEEDIQEFINVAEGNPPPSGWKWPDTSAEPRRPSAG